MPASHLLPNLEILQEEYLLVEAWKKTVGHMRAHNWFADTLEIDRASVDLPRFLKDLARRMSDPSGFETRRLRLVPAPKSHRWTFTNTGDRVKWEPEVDPNGLGPRVRPLAHVDLSDQVAATAILLCLADRVETEQGNPAASLVDGVNRRQVLSYGNRLLCDVDGGRLNHRWGSRALYRSFFQDYRTFLSRPSVAAESVSGDGEDIVVVQSDLRNFYDRVRPALLAQKIHALRLEGEHNDFFDLAEKVLTWRWDPRDQAGVNAYAEREGIPDFADVALPQGLASAGFFANVVLLEFDHRLIDSFSREIFTGAYLVDATRYVDDLRIVLKLNSERDLSEVENDTSAWLTSLVKDEPGVTVSTEKTHAAYFGVHVNRPTVRQSDRMTRIQSAVSGGFDVAGGEAILEAIRGLMQIQQRHPQQPYDAAGWPLTPVADVPDATVARFAAGRFRRAYRWLRPLVEGSESSSEDGETGEAEPVLATSARVRTQAELDNDAEVFAAGLIQTWVEDPSNIRLLRIALDIWPSASTVKRVLNLLVPYAEGEGEGEGDDEAYQVAQYCLAELLRSGATETGLVEYTEMLPLEINEYRAVLQQVSEWIVQNEEAEIPWYLRQQALLFLATCDSTHVSPDGREHETSHYAALLRFLSDPDSASSPTDFATYSVLARRSLAPSRAARMLVPHMNRIRLTKIAEADPAFALELVEIDSTLSAFLPDHIKRDLCLIRTLPAGSISLAELVLGKEHPFRDELALLQFAAKALKILRRGQSGTVAPVDLEVTIRDPEPWGVREGKFELRLHYRRQLKNSVYSPPSWCPDDQRWRFQLGYLLRFILTCSADFTASVRPTSWRESRGNSYRPVPMSWRMRRYGFFNAHEAFGDRWLPITEWTTALLLDLLAWPGARRPNNPWIEQGIDQTAAAVQERINEILNLQGCGRSELLLKVALHPPEPITKDRSLKAAVVQTVLPKQCWFKPGNEALTRSNRKLLRRHLTAALASVRSTLRLRRTHMNGGGELDLLILPELAVHTDDLEVLKRFAITHHTIILAGLVYHEARAGDGLPLVNSAVWLLPERTGFGGRTVRVVDQGKRYLAPEETQAGLNVRPFRTSQWLIGYPWSRDSREPNLWLTASVCYDATDLALAADLKGRSDIYVIPALNQDVPTFDKMALALHYHMFQMVVVANNGEFGGSNAYVPYKDRFKRQLFHFHGQPQAAIAYLEVDKIRAFLERVKNSQDPKKEHQYKQPPAGLI